MSEKQIAVTKQVLDVFSQHPNDMAFVVPFGIVDDKVFVTIRGPIPTGPGEYRAVESYAMPNADAVDVIAFLLHEMPWSALRDRASELQTIIHQRVEHQRQNDDGAGEVQKWADYTNGADS